MRIRWSDLLFVGFGGAVGYQMQVASVVEGTSMLPTLQPHQRLLHFPYWYLGWWCWPMVQVVGLGQRLYASFIPANSHKSIEPPRLSWSGHTNPQVGDVVLAIVKDDGTTVCKRVVSITDKFEEVVLGEWEAERFRTDGCPADDLHESYDERAHRMEEMEDAGESYGALQNAQHVSNQTALPEGSMLYPNEPTSDHLLALHSSQQRLEGATDSEARETGVHIKAKPALPRRSTVWDECRDKGIRRVQEGASSGQLEQWLWLEGDNALNSFDSRQAGAIPSSCIKGMVVAVWWPLHNMRLM